MTHPKITQLLAEHERNRQTLHSQSWDFFQIDAVMAECKITTFHTSVWSFCGEIDLIIPITSVDDLAGVLAGFARRGYRRTKDDVEKVNYASGGFKWYLAQPRGAQNGKITVFGKIVEAEEDAPAANCKIVQTGVRTVEQPIYEVVCEEEEVEHA